MRERAPKKAKIGIRYIQLERTRIHLYPGLLPDSIPRYRGKNNTTKADLINSYSFSTLNRYISILKSMYYESIITNFAILYSLEISSQEEITTENNLLFFY